MRVSALLIPCVHIHICCIEQSTGQSITLKHMNTSQVHADADPSTERPWFVWVTYGLLFVWMCLGSVALAEQVNLFAETSTQDEDALVGLTMALHDEGPSLDGRLISAVRNILPLQLPSLPSDSVFFSASGPMGRSPTLRSHQCVSIYRI